MLIAGRALLSNNKFLQLTTTLKAFQKKINNGSEYIGELNGEKKHGFGAISISDGRLYVGEWQNDKKSGIGTFTCPNGEKYVGEWMDDRRNGQGTHTWPNG